MPFAFLQNLFRKKPQPKLIAPPEPNNAALIVPYVIHCLFDRLVPVSELRAHPKNRNEHPKDQIERLAKILKYQGWRYPIKVSKRSGFITSGHGRLAAAQLNGWDALPVNFQDYESEEQEYADVQSDNAIASWAELDMAGINFEIGDLGPNFDIDLLGIKDFTLDPIAEEPKDEKLIECPNCGEKFTPPKKKRKKLDG